MVAYELGEIAPFTPLVFVRLSDRTQLCPTIKWVPCRSATFAWNMLKSSGKRKDVNYVGKAKPANFKEPCNLTTRRPLASFKRHPARAMPFYNYALTAQGL